MKRTKRWLAALLSAVLLLGLLPATALAAEVNSASWAYPAVRALNGIYGGVFSTSEGLMTEADVAAIFDPTAYGYTTDPGDFKTLEDGAEVLTRGGAARILTKIYGINTSPKSPIQYLFDQGIINGYQAPDDTPVLGENDPINQATFAVLTYRILDAVGIGNGTGSNLTPGTREYFCWMYLAARRCVVPTYDENETFTVETWTGYENNGEHVNGWEDYLRMAGSALNESRDFTDDEIEAAKAAVIGAAAGGGEEVKTTGILEAAKAVVGVLEQKVGTIFADVPTNMYCYDGVMYLLDNGVIQGYGDGHFRPNKPLTRLELIQVMSRFDSSLKTEMDRIRAQVAAQYDPDMTETEEGNLFWVNYGSELIALTSDRGYVDWHAPTAEELAELNDPAKLNGRTGDLAVTRKELIMGLLKTYVPTQNPSELSKLNNSNTAILERFRDYDYRNDPAAHALAYAVCRGIVSGFNETTLGPDARAERGILAVLLYRVMTELDTTKMKDYADNVDFALGRIEEEEIDSQSAEMPVPEEEKEIEEAKVEEEVFEDEEAVEPEEATVEPEDEDAEEGDETEGEEIDEEEPSSEEIDPEEEVIQNEI